jgi:two-component sensor histidine kinase
VVCDEQGCVTHANTAARRLADNDPTGKPLADAFSLTLGGETGLISADDLVTVALGGGSLRGVNVVANATADGAHDLLVSAAPLMRARRRIAGCVVTMVDVTEQKALEKQQQLLTRELEHRVKNLLALVLSISSRTARATPEPRAFIERFNQRLVALGATQDLLARSGWSALSLEELVVTEFAPFLPAPSPRIRLTGLDRQVASEASIALGLAFHELVTNAVKYGALSNERGRVSITGTDGADGGLDLVWQEEDGPAVAPPSRHGFGQTLITSGFGASSGAKVEVLFPPEGVQCRMSLPASMLA